MSRDHLRVKQIKDWSIDDMVELRGEIFYPGEYLISPNETLLLCNRESWWLY